MTSPIEELEIELRKLAEERVSRGTTVVSELSEKEIKKLVYELEIHQEELEIQNEELRRSQMQLHESREEYAELYDFAPVGYLTLDSEGTIVKANLTACTMLGRNRSTLIGSRLALRCDQGSRVEFREHLESVLMESASQNCELRFQGADKMFYVRLDSNRVEIDAQQGVWQCRTIMTDISHRIEAEQALRQRELFTIPGGCSPRPDWLRRYRFQVSILQRGLRRLVRTFHGISSGNKSAPGFRFRRDRGNRRLSGRCHGRTPG